MPYEEDRWLILAAAGVATANAAVLFEYPLARNVAIMVGALVSNPGAVAKAAIEWLAPVVGEDGLDFEAISGAIVKLAEEVASKEYWTGPAWEVFKKSADDFAQQVKVASAYFQNVSSGMDTIATLYHYAVYVACLVAAITTALAAAKWLTFIVPIFVAVVMRGQINGILISLAQILRGIVGKNVKSAAMLAGILATVNGMCAMMTQVIDKGRPNAKFGPSDLEYVSNGEEKPGTLQRKNGGMPDLTTAGGLI
ncbi:hypothetical protein ACFYUV_14900 [Nonomuraea sp. NPDC003560]|uniref:hypothetical protein n=1 Tax=Nonomuraea sp. NPDC003560 TaxID=3364341 RepID=UPI0036B40772